MSLIKEHYQDEHGHWTPEALRTLAKAIAITNHIQPERTLMPLDEVEDFCLDLFEGVK